jgi:hypothetical protein
MKYLPFLFALFFSSSLFAQRKGTGMIFDSQGLRGIPYKATLTSESYGSMPSAASVEQYCPTPGDQGSYSTCVAFATAYHLRTILYNKLLSNTNGGTNRINLNGKIFSPTFVYEKIKDKDDKDCKDGSSPVDAFDLLKKSGVATLSKLPYSCGAVIKEDAIREAENFRIVDYQILYSPGEEDKKLIVNTTKKALSEGYPCMLGFIVAESFYGVKGDVWREAATDDGPTGQHGRHAMCVVGYDDKKYGGAFRVMNSWGTGWADKGFVWIPYKDFAKYAIIGIQAYGPSQTKPDPAKPVDIIAVQMKGSLKFQLNTGELMTASRTGAEQKVNNIEPSLGEELVAYKMDQSYSSGTRFRFNITTNTEAYVYAFATDLTGKVNKILPFADNMSPHIGANSTVAFPAENKVIKMDDNPGTDFLLVLYSQERLDAAGMLATMNTMKGGLSQKIKMALGNKLINTNYINYHTQDIGFDVRTGHTGTVVPVMVSITHK